VVGQNVVGESRGALSDEFERAAQQQSRADHRGVPNSQFLDEFVPQILSYFTAFIHVHVFLVLQRVLEVVDEELTFRLLVLGAEVQVALFQRFLVLTYTLLLVRQMLLLRLAITFCEHAFRINVFFVEHFFLDLLFVKVFFILILRRFLIILV